MIDTPELLQSLLARIVRAGAVALDTEFVWERTYYPRLGIVQAGLADGTCELIDATVLDLTPLGPILASPGVQKIFHDAQQDLTILRRASGTPPRNVFDTRLAAGFAGFVSTISLQQLLSELLGLDLAKTETRTDWIRRPLSDKQIEYALDDVRYMIRARDTLLERARRFGNEQWLSEEQTQYDTPSMYDDREPRVQFERVKGCGKLRGRKLAVLRELAAWREYEARRRDVPRDYVIPDIVLMEISLVIPGSTESLSKVKGFSANMLTRYGEQVMAQIEIGLEISRRECPRLGPRHRRANAKALVDNALALVRDRCLARNIDPTLVVTRSELTSLAHQTDEASGEQFRVLSGWRRGFVGEELLAMLSG